MVRKETLLSILLLIPSLKDNEDKLARAMAEFKKMDEKYGKFAHRDLEMEKKNNLIEMIIEAHKFPDCEELDEAIDKVDMEINVIENFRKLF